VRQLLGAGALVLGILASPGCAPPPSSDSAFRSEAQQSAEAMVSELRTTLVATQTQLDDNAWWRYTDVVVTEAETAAGTIEETFTSLQPPSHGIEPLYDETSRSLGDAADLLTEMRVAVRWRDTARIRSLRPQIDRAADELETLEESLV
jgi:hypothetical protein